MKHVVKMTELYAPTLKEDPVEAELASHRLLLRAGMIRRLAAGVYTYLPLGWRVIKKAETIIREEMDAIGSQEICMPVMQPAELWHESGRWNDYGPELMRLKDRHDRDFCLGPTHEEVVTELVKNELKSYRDLPKSLYQIQVKFRDEIRPRFGLLRGREFIMKDAYTFHANHEDLVDTYNKFFGAYARVCERMGLDYRPVKADSGQIGGSETIEFMALAESGEAEIVFCEGYAADAEAAVAKPVLTKVDATEMTEVHTPGATSIADVAAQLDLPENACVKAMALIAEDGTPYVLFIPGDHELNEIKVARFLGEGYRMMEEEDLTKNNLVKGFIGPVNISDSVSIIADASLQDVTSWVCGANKVDYHLVGAQMGTDFPTPRFEDLIMVQAGDIHMETGEPLQSARGIEVSQIFQLGTKYSEALNARYVDEDGQEQPFHMGCYGIGVSRSVAAIVEQYNDEYGIKWPVNVAPFEVSVIPLSVGDELVYPVADKIAAQLAEANIEVVLDDRKERPGVKFADNDLMGFPYQVVCGKRGVDQGVVEVKDRQTNEKTEVPLDEVAAYVTKLVESKRF